ncbi:hypothetical protein V6Z11_D10G222800 [Gossypium hirsutum]
MASNVKASTALVLSLNLLFFAFVSSHNVENPVFIHPGDVYHNGRITHGHPEPCCSVIQGLVDLEAAVCLCTAVRANVLGIPIHLPISLSLLLNKCGREVATEYICSP